MAKAKTIKEPFTPIDPALQYLVSVVGTGGRLNQLETEIAERWAVTRVHERIHAISEPLDKYTFKPCVLFWTSRSEDRVEFELYTARPISTKTQAFRKGLGELIISEAFFKSFASDFVLRFLILSSNSGIL